MFSKLLKKNKEYKPGQVWEYETRAGEEDSTFTIVGVEHHDTAGTIINIYVEGLKISSPGDSDYITVIHHMPFSKEAIDKSVKKVKGTAQTLPDFKEGYDQWREEFDRGKAGVFSIPVREAIEFMEQAINS